MVKGCGGKSGRDQWNRVLYQLSAEPRRQIITSLSNVPNERWLRLLGDVFRLTDNIDQKAFAIKLKHHHLPSLADVGYIRWESNPLCVQRGPNFEEAENIVQILFISGD